MTHPTPSSLSSVSGQQVGLLGGPLFILYKILGVYRLAETPEKGLPTDLTPVFWLEGNDADLNEIATFHGLNIKGEIRSYCWNPKQLKGQPIGNYLVDEDLLNLYRDYFSYVPSTSHSDDVQELIFSSYQLGKTILDANQKLFSQLLQGFEDSHSFKKKMTWFRSDEEGFRYFSQNILQEEISRSKEGQCPVFGLIDNRREALFKKSGYCYTRSEEKINIEKTTLLPSVWNRSILQDAYWQVAAYVAGKAEQKYLEELKPSYSYHQVKPSQVIPRMSVTVTDKILEQDAYDLSLNIEKIIHENNREIVSELQARDPVLKTSLRELKQRLRQEKDHSMTEYRSQGGGDRGYEKKLYVAMKHRLGEERKNFKERGRNDLAKLQNLVSWLHPSIKGMGSLQLPQERLHNIVTFLNLYGLKAIPSIYREYQFINKVIHLDR